MAGVKTAMLLHGDRSECHHHGEPITPAGWDSPPRCPGAQDIAWVRTGSAVIGVTDAYTMIAEPARAVFEAARPDMTAALAKTLARIFADPAVAALAAAATAMDAPAPRGGRGFAGDPCGSGPQTP